MLAETRKFVELSKPESRLLSEIFLDLAKAREGIAKELEQEKLSIVSDSYASVICGLFEADFEKHEQEKYWREASYERLAALAGPYNLWNRKIPDFSCYRSSYLDKVVQKAAAEFQGPPADPVLRRLMVGEGREDLQNSLNEKMTEARIAAGACIANAAIGFQNVPRISDDANWLDICDEALNELMGRKGFTKAEKKKNDFVAYRQTIYGTNFSFVVLLDDLSDLELGKLNVTFLLAHKRTLIAPQAIEFKAYATFFGHDLVPGINYSFIFKKFDWSQMLASASTAASLAGSVFVRLQSLLQSNWVTSGPIGDGGN